MSNIVSREEKLILQMKNIEAIYTNNELSAENKVYQITSVMSYLNEIVNSLIEPLREESKGSFIVQMANDNFIEFVEKDE